MTAQFYGTIKEIKEREEPMTKEKTTLERYEEVIQQLRSLPTLTERQAIRLHTNAILELAERLEKVENDYLSRYSNHGDSPYGTLFKIQERLNSAFEQANIKWRHTDSGEEAYIAPASNDASDLRSSAAQPNVESIMSFCGIPVVRTDDPFLQGKNVNGVLYVSTQQEKVMQSLADSHTIRMVPATDAQPDTVSPVDVSESIKVLQQVADQCAPIRNADSSHDISTNKIRIANQCQDAIDILQNHQSVSHGRERK